MGILHGRTMAISGTLAVVAAIVSLCLKIEARIILAIAALLCAAVCLILFLCKKASGFRMFSVLIIIVIFICSLLRGHSFFDIECENAKSLCGENLWVRGIVTDVGYDEGFVSYYDVVLTEVNKEECNIKARLRCEFFKKLSRGDGFAVKCETITSTIGGEENSSLYRVADGVLLEAIATESDKLYINSIGNRTPLMRLADLNKTLSDVITESVDGEAGALASAMLLGNKQLLSDATVRDFRRSGMSHLLAVSGLHVSIIVGIVGFALMKMRINRHVRNILLAIFALAYLFVLGFPISAVRSVIMVCIVYFVYYIGDEADGVSSLGIAASIVMLVSPSSVLDMGFVLSFSATLGIVVFMPLLQDLYLNIQRWALSKFKKKNKINRIKSAIIRACLSVVYWFVGIFVSSFSAMLMTMLPIALCFEELAIYSTESNFLATFLVTPFLFCTLLLIPTTLIFGEGFIIGDGVGLFGDKLLDLARRLSFSDSATLSLKQSVLKLVVVGVFAFVVVLLLLNFKHKKWFLLLPLHYPLVLLALVLISGHIESDVASASVLSVKGDEQIVLCRGYSAAIIDFSDGSYSDLRRSASLASEGGATECSSLVLTHYHKKHLSSVKLFLQNEKVDTLALAKPKTFEDAQIMRELYEIAIAEAVDVCIYETGEMLTLIDGVSVTLTASERIMNGDSPVCYLLAESGEKSLFYIGESAWLADEEMLLQMQTFALRGDVILFGAHGEKCKTPPSPEIKEYEEVVVFDHELLPILLDSKSGMASGILHSDRVIVSPQMYRFVFD